MRFLLVNENKDPEHLDYGRSIPVTRGGKLFQTWQSHFVIDSFPINLPHQGVMVSNNIIIIIRQHCLGLGHETIICAVCLTTSLLVYSCFFLLKDLCDLVVEAVFPSCAIWLLLDDQQSINAACMSALKSGKALREVPKHMDAKPWMLIAGSQGEGLTLQTGWGHPWPDIDMMILYGKYLGVNIPRDQLTRYQSPQSSLSVTIFQGCHSNSYLEYAPENCPPAFAKLRVMNIQELIKGYSFDLSTCLEQRDGHIWMNTARLNQLLIWFYNTYGEKTGERDIVGVGGPAGQVISKE